LGVFGADRLLAMLLPRVATLESGVSDLAFVSDTLDDLREKMRAVAARPVGEFIERDATVVHRDTPLPEIMLLLYRGENDLPLVERGSNKLLGVVSAADVLHAVGTGDGR
jgi:CBS domain-containing protein